LYIEIRDLRPRREFRLPYKYNVICIYIFILLRVCVYIYIHTRLMISIIILKRTIRGDLSTHICHDCNGCRLHSRVFSSLNYDYSRLMKYYF